jgi:hypothetical protein
MFYLGSIAGFLPYILALSLTIVWGGHAGIPLLTSNSTSEEQNEFVKENESPFSGLKSFSFENQIITDKATQFPVQFFTRTKLLNFYFPRLFETTDSGISLLRAPPFSLF